MADDSLVVIRGGMLNKSSLRPDAERTFRRFGERGVSVLAAPTDDDLDLLARTVLRRYEQLTVTSAGAIRRAGLELRPTFHPPPSRSVVLAAVSSPSFGARVLAAGTP